MSRWLAIIGLCLAGVVGCAGARQQASPVPSHQADLFDGRAESPSADVPTLDPSIGDMRVDGPCRTVSHTTESPQGSHLDETVALAHAYKGDSQQSNADLGQIPRMPTGSSVTLEDVIESVYRSYPLLEAAIYARNLAGGEQIEAAGNFDLKLKAASENSPTGFYRNYRQRIGLLQPTRWGGEIYGGYRIGRGDFEPWYGERPTNKGGEFKAGISVPLARNREIDERRAAVWRATYGRELVEPEINAQLIRFIQEASHAYWQWLAAGIRYEIAKTVLKLAEDRTARIEQQVQAGLIDPPELTDNQRLVAERRAKLAESRRKVQKASVKLSIYFRGADGTPRLVGSDDLPSFPDPVAVDVEQLELDIQRALDHRPELETLNLLQQQLQVDYAQAANDLSPAVDVIVAGSQDVGAPASSKKDKSEFVLEAGVRVDVPIQRRKARGKMLALQAKIAQLSAKRRMMEDKIAADVRSAYAALVTAYEQVEQAREAMRLAEDLAQRERRNFEAGASDLLKVTLREQYARESAEKEVDALLEYFTARADYRAALAQDRPPT